MTSKFLNLLKYGIREDLVKDLISMNLCLTTLKATSVKNLVDKYNLDDEVAKELKKLVLRQPIEDKVLDELLINNNFTCCCCLGDKGKTILVHHIDEYEKTQDNSYENLAVLCPTCHELVHSSRALSLIITKEQLLKAKKSWEERCVFKRKNPETEKTIEPLVESWIGEFQIYEDRITLRYFFDLGLFISDNETYGQFTITYLNRGNIFMAGEFNHKNGIVDADISISYWGMQWGMRVSEKKNFNAIINYVFVNEIHIINLETTIIDFIPYNLVLQREIIK